MADPQPSLGELTASWDKDDPAYVFEAAVVAIIRAYNVVIPAHQAVYADLDLTLSRFALLATLDRSETGTLGLSTLGKLAFLHPATLTYTLNHLEQRRLIKRRTVAGNRRTVEATITPVGRTLVREALDRLAPRQFGLSGLNRSETVRLIELLAKIEGNTLSRDEGTATRPAKKPA